MMEENGRSRLAEWIALTNHLLFSSRLSECNINLSTVKRMEPEQSEEKNA